MSWSIGVWGCADLQSAILPPSPLRSDLLASLEADLEQGYRLMAITQAAIVDLESFTLKGAAGKRLRSGPNRKRRSGRISAETEAC